MPDITEEAPYAAGAEAEPGAAAAAPPSEVEPEWERVIQPHQGWFDLHLDELWEYRDLILLMVRRDFVAQFKQTILGPAWFVIKPLLSTIVFTIVFGHIAGISTDGLPKMLFYLSGNVLWLYFSTCLTGTANTFTGNRNLFGKVYFPRMVIPVSKIISNLLRFGLQFIFFLGFLGYFALRGAEIDPNWTVALFPVLVVLMAGTALGGGIILSSMTSKYRDIRFVLTFGVKLLMYGTPVIYPLSTIPEKYRWLVVANPMTPIIETFRYGFLGRGTFSALHLLYSAGFMLVVLFIGLLIFTRVSRTFMDTV